LRFLFAPLRLLFAPLREILSPGLITACSN
jgi:hypothetical protein